MKSNWFTRTFGWVKKQEKKDRLSVLIAYSDLSVKVTAALKKFVDGKIDNIIASQIPGVKDDAAVALLESIIPKFAMKMAILNGILKAGQTGDDFMVAIAEHVSGLRLEGKEEFYAKFGARLVLEIAEAKSDGKFEFAEAMSISQGKFLELKEAGII